MTFNRAAWASAGASIEAMTEASAPVDHQRARVMLAVMALALPANALFNYALIFGVWGFPEVGLAGPEPRHWARRY